MSRYIDANEFEKYFNREEWKTPDEKWWPEREIGLIIDAIPTAKVVEFEREYDGYKDIDGAVKKTRWQITIDNGFKMYTCPECECRMIKNHYDYAVGTNGFNFCPYCGADMRGENNELHK